MKLEDYLKSLDDKSDFHETLNTIDSDISEMKKNRFIFAYLNLKDTIEKIHIENKIENLMIVFSLIEYDDGDYLSGDIIQKGGLESDEYCEDFDEIDYDIDYNYDEDSNMNIQQTVTTNHPSLTIESQEINKYQKMIIGALKFLNCRMNKENWFGTICSNSKTIYLNNKELPDIEEWFLGNMTRPMLNKAILENRLTQKVESDISNKTNRFKV